MYAAATSVDLAVDFFDVGRQLGVAENALHELLFDSLEDLRGIVSRGAGERSAWDVLAPGYGEKDIETMFMEWTTPAAMTARAGMTAELTTELDSAGHRACLTFCHRQQAGRAHFYSEEDATHCCHPAEWCPRIHTLLWTVFSGALENLKSLHSRFLSLARRMTEVAWPWAQGWVLPIMLNATNVVDRVVWLSVFLWSRLAANPSIGNCLLSEWGRTLQPSHLAMVSLWRDARRRQENLAWELTATSRFADFRWSQLGMHFEEVDKLWQTMFNVLSISIKVLRFLDRRIGEVGWSALATKPDRAGSLEAQEHGEYPGLMLMRSQFHGAWFLDKSALRFFLRRVFKPGQSVGEFGAFGGQYSAWLNETGIVRAFAFDGIEEVPRITDGRVQGPVDLAKPVTLYRRFDWVLCLEVGEHLPKGTEDILMDNIARHAKIGAVISWATPEFPSPYHPNTLIVEESTRLIERHGFRGGRATREGGVFVPSQPALRA